MMKNKISYKLLKRLEQLETGAINLVTPEGHQHSFAGKQPGETVHVELRDWKVVNDMLFRGDIGFAEAYAAGSLETDNLVSLATLGIHNKGALKQLVSGNKFSRALSVMSYMLRLNTVKGSRRNIHEHYDLGNEFYSLWLDPTMTYSSALFKDDKESLPQAQNNKYDRIIDCFERDSGSVLEIGCGWGGFADRLLERGDFSIKGITLSDEQHKFANERLKGRGEIVLEDYRHQKGKFDHIVSIEMFEAVGEKYWPTYFGKIKELLSDNGKAVIQTITMNEKNFNTYRNGADFIRSYIFPGGLLPSPSRFAQEAERSGLKVKDPFYFGQDYAQTLEMWLKTFDEKKHAILSLGFDESFTRLWRFYLAACVAGFRTGHTNVMQVELEHA